MTAPNRRPRHGRAFKNAANRHARAAAIPAAVEAALYTLRRKCPTPLPVEVRFTKKPRGGRRSMLGKCEKDGRRFVVSIQRGHEWETTHATLLHEYAHAMTWDRADHGDAWGRAFARCYRAVS